MPSPKVPRRTSRHHQEEVGKQVTIRLTMENWSQEPKDPNNTQKEVF